jgi:hypothetical protein
MDHYLPIRINMSDYIWTAPGTDITIRWRLAGWTPPSELQEYKDKWKYFQNLPLRNLDDRAKEAYEAVLRKAKVVRLK